MEKITAYKSEDGHIFENERDAIQHDLESHQPLELWAVVLETTETYVATIWAENRVDAIRRAETDAKISKKIGSSTKVKAAFKNN